jgi:hypothetical protein
MFYVKRLSAFWIKARYKFCIIIIMTIEARYAASATGSSRIEMQAISLAVIWRSLRRQKPLGIRHGPGGTDNNQTAA